MVSKGKLKMALAAEKGTDFGKLKLKKKEKAAIKQKKQKGGVDNTAPAGKVNGKKNNGNTKGEWEDVDEEDNSDLEDGDVEVLEEDGSLEEDSDEELNAENGLNLDLAALDESDSDSSAGENDQDNSSDSEEEEEDIPISDLEDLDDEEKEDIIPHQRLTINNTTALLASLKRFALPIHKLPFSEHQSITSTTPTQIADVSDDLNRELAFYAQSLEAAKSARALLKAENVPFTRPNDYFAEMVKDDGHMEKVKGKLIEEAASKKASAEARKQRDLKKFGKQVQVAKLQERQKEKTEILEKIKVLKRKRQGADNPSTNEADLFDVALEDEVSAPSHKRSRTGKDDRSGGGAGGKRAKKDAKYGFGGKKRFAKSGDAMSSGDLSGFSSKKMKSGGGGGVKKRPGKARRAGKR